MKMNTDFTLFRCSYMHPGSNKIIDCGEMRGWHADKFVDNCEAGGVVAIVERGSDDQSLADFLINLQDHKQD